MKFKVGLATPEECLQAVKAFALEKYTKGWDIVIECYSDDDLKLMIADSRTCSGAVQHVRETLAPQLRYREDIQGG